MAEATCRWSRSGLIVFAMHDFNCRYAVWLQRARDASMPIEKQNILGDGPALEIAPKHMTALWTKHA